MGYKNEKYKNNLIIFIKSKYDGWYQPRNKFGNLTPAVRNPSIIKAYSEGFGETFGTTKEEALRKMKSLIDGILRRESRKSFVRNRYPSGTEKMMEGEWNTSLLIQR